MEKSYPSNVFFLLGCPCAGKTTVAEILARKYAMPVFSGDGRRFDYYKLAEKEKHPYMTMDASDFWSWTLEEMIAWEKGVIAEQTPFILRDLREPAETNAAVLFEGMLDPAALTEAVPTAQIAYLSVDRAVCERVFFERDDHRGMVDSIMNTPGISDEEKQRRISARRQAALDAFCIDAQSFGVRAFPREETRTPEEMAEKVAAHFGLPETR